MLPTEISLSCISFAKDQLMNALTKSLSRQPCFISSDRSKIGVSYGSIILKDRAFRNKGRKDSHIDLHLYGALFSCYRFSNSSRR